MILHDTGFVDGGCIILYDTGFVGGGCMILYDTGFVGMFHTAFVLLQQVCGISVLGRGMCSAECRSSSRVRKDPRKSWNLKVPFPGVEIHGIRPRSWRV